MSGCFFWNTVYRPISNLSAMSKIIERIVKCRITDHRTRNQLFSSFQFAYHKFHSTGIVCASVRLSCSCSNLSNIDLEFIFGTLYSGASWECLDQMRKTKPSRQGQSHRSEVIRALLQNIHIFAGSPPSVERHCCFYCCHSWMWRCNVFGCVCLSVCRSVEFRLNYLKAST